MKNIVQALLYFVVYFIFQFVVQMAFMMIGAASKRSDRFQHESSFTHNACIQCGHNCDFCFI